MLAEVLPTVQIEMNQLPVNEHISSSAEVQFHTNTFPEEQVLNIPVTPFYHIRFLTTQEEKSRSFLEGYNRAKT